MADNETNTDKNEISRAGFPKFMSLPAEIRQIIYEQVFTPYVPERREVPIEVWMKKGGRHTCFCNTHKTMQQTIDTNILLANRRVHAEAYRAFCLVNRFVMLTVPVGLGSLPCQLFRQTNTYFKQLGQSEAWPQIPGTCLHLEIDITDKVKLARPSIHEASKKHYAAVVSCTQSRGLRRILEYFASEYNFLDGYGRLLRLRFKKPFDSSDTSLAAHRALVAPFQKLGLVSVAVESEFINEDERKCLVETIEQPPYTTEQLLEVLSAGLQEGLKLSVEERCHSAGAKFEESQLQARLYLKWWLHRFPDRSSVERKAYLDLMWSLTTAEGQNALVLLHRHYDPSHDEFDKARGLALAKHTSQVLYDNARRFGTDGYGFRSGTDRAEWDYIIAVTFRLRAEHEETAGRGEIDHARHYIAGALREAPNEGRYKLEEQKIHKLLQRVPPLSRGWDTDPLHNPSAGYTYGYTTPNSTN